MKVALPAPFPPSIATFSPLLKQIFISSFAQNLFFELPKTFVIVLASITNGDSSEPFKYEFLKDSILSFFRAFKLYSSSYTVMELIKRDEFSIELIKF